jgi:hypothetical protein
MRELWAKVYAAFPYAPEPNDAVAQVDRIFRKWHPALPTGFIVEGSCRIRQEWWSAQQLENLCLRHERNSPDRDFGPIIAVEYLGHNYVVDGTNRANLWKAQKSTELREVLLISPTHVQSGA